MNWKVSDDVKNVLKFNNLSGYFKRSPDDLKTIGIILESSG